MAQGFGQMKRLLGFAAVLIFSAGIFAATLKDAQDRLSAIEEFKSGILSSSPSGFFSDEEMDALNLLYQVLEGDEYTVNSLNGEMQFSIGEYSLVETKWPTEIQAFFFGGKISYERSVDIMYSDAMEKKYVPEPQMTEYQRRDYEYYINDYETRIRSGEKFFYAELTFKLTHWQGASEYRFEPVALKIYKNSKRPRAIITIDETQSKDFFTFTEEKEFRTEKQIERNSARIKKLLKDENKNASTEKAKKKDIIFTEQKGRRAFYVSAETSTDNIDFSSTDIASYSLDNMYGTLTLGLGKFIFAGISAGIDLPSLNENVPVYSFGGIFGLNLNLGTHIRPYGQTSVYARTDDHVVFKTGAGIDFKLGKFMLNLEYSYNWSNNVNASVKDEETEKFGSYTAGIGLTW